MKIRIPTLALLALLTIFPTSCNISNQSDKGLPKLLSSDSLVTFQPDWERISEGRINLSYLIEKPAGGDGFITIKDGHFSTSSGKRFRIWGVNLTGAACFPEKENVEKVARMFSAVGINAVRFHFMDSNWGSDASIFLPEADNTQEFNPDQLDKLDYFVAALKAEGIYSNFNLNVGRTFRKGDKVPYYEYLGMAKAVTLFDDRIIHLEKEHAYKLLTHTNPYTGKKYRNEPALAFIEIVNENSLVEAWSLGNLEGTHYDKSNTTWKDIPKHYANELTTKYNSWLKTKLTDTEINLIARAAGVSENEIIPRLKSGEFAMADSFRFHTEARFIIETENSFYSGMYRFLKDSVHVQQLVSANSDHNHWKCGYALLSSCSKLDYVDGHVYWQHPNYFMDKKTGKETFSIQNTPMVNDPAHSSVAELSRSPFEGKPYTVSEINHPYPNEYACEGIPIITAYALLQDWDGFYFYTFEHADPVEWKSKTPNYFDIINDPIKLANLAAASLMFHRVDIDAAETNIIRKYNFTDLAEGIRADQKNRPFYTKGFSSVTPLLYKTRIGSFSGGENNFPAVKPSSPLISETGQLAWYHENEQGLVLANSPATQAMIGFSKTMSEVSTENMALEIQTPFASVLVSSMDEKDIGHSEKILLTCTSTSILTGAKWNAERSSLEEWGDSPFMMKPVTGMVILKNLHQSGYLKITPLNESGFLTDQISRVRIKKGKAVFAIGEVLAVWYLIEIEN